MEKVLTTITGNESNQELKDKLTFFNNYCLLAKEMLIGNSDTIRDNWNFMKGMRLMLKATYGKDYNCLYAGTDICEKCYNRNNWHNTIK
jgi:hypothetical protein